MNARNNEKSLIAGLREGNYDAYKTLYKLFYPRFLNFAASIIQDRAAAQDLVQEVFMKVWLNREKLDEDLSLSNYLYVLTKRAVLNYLRDRRFTDSIDNEAIEQSMSESVTESVVHARETEAILMAKVSGMPDQRRNVFIMSRFKGMSNKDIASSLGISEKTVERHITLALSDLRKNLS